ncbi:hypothetical protein CHS0354_017109 [Potamilus streckersoni]|uniref:Uncharacterized protein n=1 Tax=Potamilus streckersoni TaxID=2493646 RepID=A0AAE0VU10_9BIVA|nr:hypothetical protein CHS0354_017109 [Potamilus streckersoni]
MEPNFYTIENSDEFDDANKMTKTYCCQMTKEQFEEESSIETENALKTLTEYLDANPEVYRRILRRKKKQDMENAGFLSFLKVKIMDVWHGGNNPGPPVSDIECKTQLTALKHNMHRVFEYSQESKGRKRTSKRLVEKRLKDKENNDTFSKNIAPPPPPPPPLPVQMMNTPQSLVKSRMKHERNDSLGTMTPLPSIGSLSSLHQELLSSNPLKRLHSSREPRSVGCTPVVPKRGKSDESPGSMLGVQEPLYKALINSIQEKFRNIRSPSPSGSVNNSITSPTNALSPSGFTP